MSEDSILTSGKPKKLVHQIWHGASEELGTRFKDGRIDCIITDPPFGVDNKSKSAVTPHGKKMARKIANDESPEIAIATFKRVFDVLMPKVAPAADIYIFTSYQVLMDWGHMLDEYMPTFGFEREAILIWEKDGPGMGDLRIPFGMGMEFCFMYRRGVIELKTRRRNAVMHHSPIHASKLLHPHEKPSSLLEDLITASTEEGDFLVDPFGGSGSLVRAARKVRRSCVAIEYDEENFNIADKALNDGDGGFDFG